MRRPISIAVAAVAALGIAIARNGAERAPIAAREGAPPVAAPAPSLVRRLAPAREPLDEPSARARTRDAQERARGASRLVSARNSGGFPMRCCRIGVFPVVLGEVDPAMHDPAHPSIRRRETDGFGAARVAGTCVDAAGFPLEGAVPSVLLKGDDLDVALSSCPSRSTSDENGRFSVAGLLPRSGRDGESLVLRLSHERYVDEPEVPIALAEGGTTDAGTVRFEIPGGRAFGRILDETGTPRSGLGIFVLSPRDETKPPWWFDMNTHRETAADGTFSFGPLRVGRHRVFCPPLGFRPLHPIEFEVGEPGEEIDLGDLVAAEGG